LGRGLLDSLQVSGCQLEVESAQVLFQAMQLGGAGDWYEPRFLRQ
jgi:hypothetical protein